MKRTKIVKSGKTRWLSREMAMVVLFQMYNVLVQTFQLDSSNEVALAIWTMVSSYTFLVTVAAMVDMLQYLGGLSRSFQTDGINYSVFCQRLQETRSCIVSDFLPRAASAPTNDADADKKHWDSEWNKVQKYGMEASGYERACGAAIANVANQTADTAVYEGVKLIKMDGDEAGIYLWICKLALSIMSRLSERFPKDDMQLMEALDVFNLMHCPIVIAELGSYGDAEMATLTKHYGQSKTVGVKVFNPRINGAKCLIQWKLIRCSIFNAKHSGKSNARFWKEQLNGSYLDAHDCIKFLVCIWLVLPYSTCCCERGFSKMGIIKTALRNRLYIETLDALMTLSIVGPDYVPDDDT